MISSQMISQEDSNALAALLGGQVTSAPPFDPVDVQTAATVRDVRGQILAAANAQGVGVRELARRSNVSPSAVSRQLRSEGDMRFSTAVHFANVLSCRWHFLLQPIANPLNYYFDYDGLLHAIGITTVGYSTFMFPEGVVQYGAGSSGGAVGATTAISTGTSVTVTAGIPFSELQSIAAG
jgi:transcriptional regulator with XRE-family HTH domain